MDSSDHLENDSKTKEQQALNGEPTFRTFGDVSGDLGTDVVRNQFDFPVTTGGSSKNAGQLDAWLASGDGQLNARDPALTPRQKKKRSKGLPDIENLRVLACTYLVQAQQLYPDLAKQGILPVTSEATSGRRAWNYANPDAVKQAAEAHQPPSERVMYRHFRQSRSTQSSRCSLKTVPLVKSLKPSTAAPIRSIGCAVPCRQVDNNPITDQP